MGKSNYDILLLYLAVGLLYIFVAASHIYLSHQDFDTRPVIEQIDAKGTKALEISNRRITVLEDRVTLLEKQNGK